MYFLDKEKEIIDEIKKINHLIDVNSSSFFCNKYIFNEKFKYLIFTDDIFIKNKEGFSSLAEFVKEMDEKFFLLNVLDKDRSLVLHIDMDDELDIIKNIPLKLKLDKKNFKLEGGSPFNFLLTQTDSTEIIYYSNSQKWIGWFCLNWEVGVFAFENENIAKKFFNKLKKEEIYQIEEVIDEIWSEPLPEIKKAFLKNYKGKSYSFK